MGAITKAEIGAGVSNRGHRYLHPALETMSRDELEAVLIGQPGLAPLYQIVVQRQGALDSLSVDVEVQPGVPIESFEQVAQDLAHRIKSLVGISAEVLVKAPGAIPRSMGKAVRVRDLRPKGE